MIKNAFSICQKILFFWDCQLSLLFFELADFLPTFGVPHLLENRFRGGQDKANLKLATWVVS